MSVILNRLHVHHAHFRRQVCSFCVLKGGFRGIQEIAASMTKLLPNVADSDTDYENLMIGLLRIQVLASMTHHKAKQVRQQQAEAQVNSAPGNLP